jgi:uncharacterized protein (TIGR00369 family)
MSLLDRLSLVTHSESMIETQEMADAAASVRTRIFTWADPAATMAGGAQRSGREHLEALARGEVPSPPVAHMVDFESFDVVDDTVVVTMRPQEFHYNPLGTVHGGVIALLLDTVAGCAVHLTLPAGQGYTSLDLDTKFVRPVTVASGTVRAVGRVVHRGSRVAHAEATLTDESGRVLATATSSCVILGAA